MLDLGEFAEIISKEAVAAILARRLDAAAAMRRADAAVQRLKGVRWHLSVRRVALTNSARRLLAYLAYLAEIISANSPRFSSN